MSATSRPEDHDHPREPVRTDRRWRLGSVRLTDACGHWRASIELQGPLRPPAWWLAHAHGFLVDDEAERPVGVVEDVLLDVNTRHPRALVVVEGWRRRWLVVPVEAVIEITPAERRLTVVAPPHLDCLGHAGNH